MKGQIIRSDISFNPVQRLEIKEPYSYTYNSAGDIKKTNGINYATMAIKSTF